MSQSAMSIALMPNVTRPPLPSQYVASRSRLQIPTTSRGSAPTTRGASRRSTTKATASDVSCAPVMASPQPTSPSPASTRISVSDRILPLLFGSG